MTVLRRKIIRKENQGTPESAFSLRKVVSAYAGNCIQVRRSSDNALQNIGFDANGDLDTASLLTFIGANSGFVRIWYDQSGNGANLIQTTNSRQPLIVSAGTLNTLNGKPALYFDGSNTMVNTAARSFYNFLHNGTSSAIFVVARFGITSNPNAQYMICCSAQNTAGAGIQFLYQDDGGDNDAIRGVIYKASAGIVQSSATAQNAVSPNTQQLAYVYFDADNATLSERDKVYSNNSDVLDVNTINETHRTINAQVGLVLGSRNTADRFIIGDIQEFILYNTHPKRQNIVNYINSYWGII